MVWNDESGKWLKCCTTDFPWNPLLKCDDVSFLELVKFHKATGSGRKSIKCNKCTLSKLVNKKNSFAVVDPGFPLGGAHLVGGMAPTPDTATFCKIC